MKKDTIVFINSQKLTSVVAKQLDIPKFAASGYRVVYLDLSEYYFPERYDRYGASNKDYMVEVDAVVCKSRRQIMEHTKKESKRAIFYVLFRNLHFKPRDVWMLRAFKKYKCDYFTGCYWPVFTPSDVIVNDNVNMARYIRDNISMGFLVRQIKKIPAKLVSYCVRNGVFLQNPRFFFIAGDSWKKKAVGMLKKTEIVSVPSFDHEMAVKAFADKDNVPKDLFCDGNFMVYLDQGIFDSPDAKLLGKNTIDKGIFFKKINNFFDRLEKITGKKIIIAASPKQKYEGNEYGSREIVYGTAPALTYHADMVIAHSTTAINFAIIMNKPLLLLEFSDFSDFVKGTIAPWAKALGRTIVDSEELFDSDRIEEASKIDKDKYTAYICNYIVSHCPDKPAVDIILDKLGEI